MEVPDSLQQLDRVALNARLGDGAGTHVREQVSLAELREERDVPALLEDKQQVEQVGRLVVFLLEVIHHADIVERILVFSSRSGTRPSEVRAHLVAISAHVKHHIGCLHHLANDCLVLCAVSLQAVTRHWSALAVCQLATTNLCDCEASCEEILFAPKDGALVEGIATGPVGLEVPEGVHLVRGSHRLLRGLAAHK